MIENKVTLKTYPDVLKELEITKPNNHLLLGNGFNLSLGIKTNYENIFKTMKDNNKDFDSIITENFNLEEFIGYCKNNIKEKDNVYAYFMKRYFHNKIKLDFMKAVTQIVAKEVKNIYQEKNEDIYMLLKQFDTYFTLNYDPFLYQLLMTFKKGDKDISITFKNSLPEIKEMMDEKSIKILEEIKNGYDSGILTINISGHPKEMDLNKLKKVDFKKQMTLYFGGQFSTKQLDQIIEYFWEIKDTNNEKLLEKVNDGFGLFGKELAYRNPRTQNLYFLHGAFHIYSKRKSIYKITQQSEKALYKHIEEIVEDAKENIICIFSDKDKKTEIMQNEYLMNGFNRLAELEGCMLILGSSLADNDSHIFDQINKSRIEKIYISSSEKSKDKDTEKARQYFTNKQIIPFDRETITYIKAAVI